MKQRHTLITIACGTIVLVVTLFMFFLNVNTRESIDWAALLFMVLGEVVFFNGIIVIDNLAQRGSGLMLRAGGFTVLSFYGIAAVLLSILFLNAFRTHLGLLISFQLAILAAAVIVLIVLYGAARGVGEREAVTADSMNQMRELYNQADTLARQYRGTKHSRQLEAIAEAIRYCDYSSYTADDKAIQEKLRLLGEVLQDSSIDSSPATGSADSATSNTETDPVSKSDLTAEAGSDSEAAPTLGAGSAAEHQLQASDEVPALCEELLALVRRRQGAVKTAKQGGF